MGYLFFYLIIFILSIPALIFSILSWRLRTPVMFWLGVGFTGLLLVMMLFNFDFIYSLVTQIENGIQGILIIAMLFLPVLFLILSKTSKPDSGNDSEVTDDYLTKIIESEDEEINYEE
ncbi:MAG: hypothetical protein IPM77_10390 [Crocinitomicaceae bacterium]|nr:hypothetical protein [Crocinitomicaceae bacterium]